MKTKEKNFMHYIEALHMYNGKETSLFLAGGITDCPDWQKEMIEKLKDSPLVLLNPRRTSFPIEERSTAREQIEWEHIHLRKATAISFWFPCETLNPIVLYELGAWSMTEKKLFVGVHPDYQRMQDVQIQTALARPDVQVVMSIEELAQQVVSWAKNVQ
ncbi:MAG TPA: nucleoside 2-deoxyribosyltransferase domain-containing protein [Ktedonobacteraceae bacterium]|nr:nucleoside 2-deoxyribosyltransferase domain-containing protein [Ktedonobacteraceae bacterium]